MEEIAVTSERHLEVDKERVVQFEVKAESWDRNAKATKADDAAIPEYLWNRRITPTLDPLVIAKLDVIRRFALRWWNRNLEHGFFLWFKAAHPSEDLLDFVYKVNRKRKHPQAERDWDASMDCLRRSRRSTWWEWSDGSRPYFWRWPEEYQEIIRDGLPIWELDTLPTWLVPQRGEKVLTFVVGICFAAARCSLGAMQQISFSDSCQRDLTHVDEPVYEQPRCNPGTWTSLC